MDKTIRLNDLEAFGIGTRAIITELEERFPPFNPAPDQSLSQIMYRAGQRDVVLWILHRISEDYGK